ncbi:MAG: EAL domain-containing protein [Arcobacteraceae bacterium]|nr:EAL domain-containing protein [Arcobacteraceae bacterium]
MFKLNLSKRLFWFVTLCIVIANLFMALHLYKQTQELVETRAKARAGTLQNYFISMRYTYHQQFLQSGFEIDDKTVGFLPAHASSLISDYFKNLMSDGTTIRNVSDNPRNPTNKADIFEEKSIKYFIDNPNESSKMELIVEDGVEKFFYSSPLKIEAYCISCHGKKEEVLPYVLKRYDTAYDYKIGDVRGVTSIKIPKKILSDASMSIFIDHLLFNWAIMFFLLAIIYYVIRELTIKDVNAKELLQLEVNKKTADLLKSTKELEIANEKQKHLFSILRTVADCNQILITTSTLDELISKTAESMHLNKSFSGVKIMVKEDNELIVKASLGLDEERYVLPLERQVYETNTELILNGEDHRMPPECLDKVRRYNIKEVYSVPLSKDSFAKEAFGVMTICSQEDVGMSEEEKAMIKELAGDVGFAINSFLQKDLIQKLSFFDTLTNLPNKKFLLSQLAKSISRTSENQEFEAVLYINIDNFKSINDIKGIHAGDKILQDISQRLLEIIERNDMLFHIGGDEFIVLLEHVGQNFDKAVKESHRYAQEILTIVKNPFVVEEQNFYLSLCIGVALFSDDKNSEYEILNNAESAMHLAKNRGKNSISFYDQSSQEIAITRSVMIQNLKEALISDEFFLLYQKQVIVTGDVVGVEALVRWNHPQLGIVSPGVFIPLVEETGLINELGDWIIKQAITQLTIWSFEENKKEWRISVNVSPLQFNEDLFVDNLNNMLKQSKITPDKLRLELTEGILISDVDKVYKKLIELKNLGFSISVDDFGTGYSSLSYLKNLPLDELKIDQSFVANLSDNDADKTIVQTIISIGEAFGFEVIAEGVETKEQLDILKNLGCKYFQGYLFAKPQDTLDL